MAAIPAVMMFAVSLPAVRAPIKAFHGYVTDSPLAGDMQRTPGAGLMRSQAAR